MLANNRPNLLTSPIFLTTDGSIRPPMPAEYIHRCDICNMDILPAWSQYRQRWQYVPDCDCVSFTKYVETRYQQWIALSGIPVKYANHLLSQFTGPDNLSALRHAQALLEHHYNFCLRPDLEGMSLLLQGPQGTGKSLLSAAIVMELFARAKQLLQEERTNEADQVASIAFVSGIGLYHQALGDDTAKKGLASLGKGAKKLATWNDKLSHYQSVRLLILDDVGKEPVRQENNFVGSYLFDIINARYEANLSTIITCNGTLASIPDNFLQPILGRIKETGYYVPLTGASKRTAKYPALVS